MLILLLPVLAVGAVGNQQIFNAYLLWVPDHIDMVFFGRTMPTTWLITLDAAVSVEPVWQERWRFWRLWARRFKEPSEVVKITIGMGISACALLVAGGRGGHLRRGPQGRHRAGCWHLR